MKQMESHNAGEGQSVQVVIGEGLGRWVFGAVAVLVLMVAFVTHSATQAASEATRARQSANLAGVNGDYNTQAILIWMREAKAAGDAAGAKMPPIPKLKMMTEAN